MMVWAWANGVAAWHLGQERGSGEISLEELGTVGEARHTTGQKTRVRTAERNEAFMSKLDGDSSGMVGRWEFVEYFQESVRSKAQQQSEAQIKEYLLAVAACKANTGPLLCLTLCCS